MLLCVTCLQSAVQERQTRRRVFRRFLPAAMALAGFVLAWFVFYGVGQAFLESLARPEQTWQDQ